MTSKARSCRVCGCHLERANTSPEGPRHQVCVEKAPLQRCGFGCGVAYLETKKHHFQRGTGEAAELLKPAALRTTRWSHSCLLAWYCQLCGWKDGSCLAHHALVSLHNFLIPSRGHCACWALWNLLLESVPCNPSEGKFVLLFKKKREGLDLRSFACLALDFQRCFLCSGF